VLLKCCYRVANVLDVLGRHNTVARVHTASALSVSKKCPDE